MQRAEQRERDGSLMREPSNECDGEQQTENGAGAGEDEAFSQQLANDAGAAGAESAAHSELLGARGRTGEQQVGQVDAGDEQDGADGAPEHDEGTAQFTADVILEWNGDDGIFVAAAGLWIFVVPAHVGRGRRCVLPGLGERDAGFEAADEGDDVAPVARRAVEIERRDGVDFCAGSEDSAEVEGCGQNADDGGLMAVDVEGFADDIWIRVELAAPPGIGEEDDGRCAIAGVVCREDAAHRGLHPEQLKEVGDDIDAGGGDGCAAAIEAEVACA